MKKVFILLLLTSVLACGIQNIVVGTNAQCSENIPIKQANVYVNENFFVCGETNETQLTAKESFVMEEQTVPVIEKKFSLLGYANTNKHKVYYIQVNGSNCSQEIPLEIKDKCVMLPPSNIRVIPNYVEPGQNFVLEVSNADREMEMEVTGLTNDIITVIQKDQAWSKTISSNECPNGCTLKFKFTDTQHEICSHDTATIEVKQKINTGNEVTVSETNILYLLGLLVLIIIGTAIAVWINK